MKKPSFLKNVVTRFIGFKKFVGRKKFTFNFPVDAGRISRETSLDMLRRFAGDWTFIDPDIPAHILEAIERFTIIIPDFSQNARNIVNLGNTGHTLEVEAATERIIQQAEDRLNLLARTIYPYGGTDGLVNKMLWDIAVFGAPSIEAVIQPDLKGVQKVVIVAHPEIRFKYDKEQDEYLAYQKAGNSPDDYLELNPLTYYYSPLFQRRNSPYAIPPMLAALSPLLNQLFMQENIRHIVKKIGLLGLIHAVLTTPPRKPQETEEQYLSRLKNYLSNVATDLTKNYRDGVMITYDEFELNHFPVTGDIRGVKDLFQMNEEQLSSGMGTDPAMLGRTYSTTETYAGVVYTKMIKEIDNARRITRRGIEKIYLLDLLLGQIPVIDVNLEFDPDAELKPAENAEIKETERTSISGLYRDGIITLDEAREDLEYPPLETLETLPSASSQGLPFSSPQGFSSLSLRGAKRRSNLKARFKFSRGKYIFQHPRICIITTKNVLAKTTKNMVAETTKNVVAELALQKSISLMSEESIENRRMKFLNQYLSDIVEIDEATRDQIIEELKARASRGEFPEEPEAFAREVYTTVEKLYPGIARNQGLSDTINNNLQKIYTYYRLSDTSLWGDAPPVKTSLEMPDKRAQEFLTRMDDIFFSEYVQNEPFKKELTEFLRDEVMEKGFQATDAVIERFGTAWADGSELQVRRIVDTSVTRVRTFAHIRQMRQAGIKELEIIEIMDRITCGLCREADGKIIRVAIADEIVENALALSPEQFKSQYITGIATQREMMSMDIEDLTREGKGLPPLHPNCRGRTKTRFTKSLIEIEKEKGALPDIEKHMNADYSDYGKKMKFKYWEKPNPRHKPVERKTNQTLVYSMTNPLGKKVYQTKQAIKHGKDHNRPISIAGTVVATPDQIFIDTAKGNDTKIYTKHIRGKNYATVTKRVGPEIIWTAFDYNRNPSPTWDEIWHRR